MAYFAVGMIGIFLYTAMFAIATSCYHQAINRYTRRIFLLLSLFAILELPMYYHLAIYKDFGGVVIYAINMFSSVCYFGTFSVVCFAWGDVLRAKNLEVLFEARRRQIMRYALVVLNILFGMFVCTMAAICVSSKNLDTFLASGVNLLFVAVDTFKNIFIGIFIAHFGSSLRARLQNYCGTGSARGGIIRMAIAENSAHLMRVCNKLLLLVWVSILSFCLKVIAVFVYRTTSAPSEYEPPGIVREIEVLWWIVFEFVPVGVPSFAFFLTMGWPSRLIDRNGLSFPDHTTMSSGQVISGFHTASGSNDDHMASVESDTPATSADIDDDGRGVSFAAQKILQQRHSIVNDDDCFHIMERLSSMSADLVDIELNRNSEYTAEMRNSLNMTAVKDTHRSADAGDASQQSNSMSVSMSAFKKIFSGGK